MNTFFSKLRLVFSEPILRRRIITTVVLLAVFRLLAAIPMPGINAARLQELFSGSQFLGLINIFSGGALSQVSIVMLGVGPYITATIIMQLMTMLSPRLKAMYQEEGEIGRRKFSQYSRMLTVPLAIIQGYSFLILFQRQGIFTDLTTMDLVRNLAIISAGSLFLMWLGERITEFGIGNGVSLIIFGGIVADIPRNFGTLLYGYTPDLLTTYIALFAAALIVIYAVVVITEAERPIPITYAKRVRGNKVYGGISTYLPLRLNQTGVIPIIFALSILLFPQIIFRFITSLQVAVQYPIVKTASDQVLRFLENQWYYAILYFILVVAFTYFYTALTFEPNTIATNLQKNGAFIPGVRPGHSTAVHISRIITRITAFGALFLGLVAVLPLLVRAFTGITAIAIGGTALLIVVSVIIDLIRKVEAQVSVREY